MLVVPCAASQTTRPIPPVAARTEAAKWTRRDFATTTNMMLATISKNSDPERVNDFATRVDLSLSSGFHAAPFFSGGLIQTASGNSGGCGGFLTKRWGFLA